MCTRPRTPPSCEPSFCLSLPRAGLWVLLRRGALSGPPPPPMTLQLMWELGHDLQACLCAQERLWLFESSAPPLWSWSAAGSLPGWPLTGLAVQEAGGSLWRGRQRTRGAGTLSWKSSRGHFLAVSPWPGY